MSRTFRFAGAAVAALLLLSPGQALAQTNIRPDPGGSRLLFVDGPDIRPDPGGKRLLFIDGVNIRPDPGGKRLLFIDGDNIRPEPGGLRLLFIDGQNIRRTPGGDRLLFIDGPNIRPDPGGKRLYFMDGPALSRGQLVAVLYQLMPELFKLTQEQERAQLKARQEAAAEVEAEARRDQAPGAWGILSFTSDDDTTRAGKVAIAKAGDAYTLRLAYNGSEPWEGVAIKDGDELWGAIGPVGKTELGVFKIEGGKLSGTLTASDAAGDAAKAGTATLEGAATLGGEYRLAGKAPKTGAALSGTLVLAPQTRVTLGSGDGQGYLLAYDEAGTPMAGAAFRAKDKLLACATSGSDCAVLRLELKSSILAGDFLSAARATGSYTLSKE